MHVIVFPCTAQGKYKHEGVRKCILFTSFATLLHAFFVSSILEYPASLTLFKTECFSIYSTNFILTFARLLLNTKAQYIKKTVRYISQRETE